jgi:hypothetical protein
MKTFIEAMADEIIPVTKFSTPSGEGFKFMHVNAVVGLLVKAYVRFGGIGQIQAYQMVQFC